MESKPSYVRQENPKNNGISKSYNGIQWSRLVEVLLLIFFETSVVLMCWWLIALFRRISLRVMKTDNIIIVTFVWLSQQQLLNLCLYAIDSFNESKYAQNFY